MVIWGEQSKLPQWGPGQSPGRKRILEIFAPLKLHLVTQFCLLQFFPGDCIQLIPWEVAEYSRFSRFVATLTDEPEITRRATLQEKEGFLSVPGNSLEAHLTITAARHWTLATDKMYLALQARVGGGWDSWAGDLARPLKASALIISSLYIRISEARKSTLAQACMQRQILTIRWTL